MEMTLEQAFRYRLIVKLRKAGFYVVGIETKTKAGVPDLYVCFEGYSAWIELKATPRKLGLRVRKEQRLFGIKHADAGGTTLLIHLINEGKIADIYLQPFEKVEVRGKYLVPVQDPDWTVHEKDLARSLKNILPAL